MQLKYVYNHGMDTLLLHRKITRQCNNLSAIHYYNNTSKGYE